MQFGGLPGRGTTQAAHLLRTARQVARMRSQAFGVIFVDVVQAFYRSIRELLFQDRLDDEHVARLVAASGLPPSAMAALAAQIRQRLPLLA